MKNQAGFTLLELLISMVIVGILMANASNILRSYDRKARVAEGILMASPIKHGVFEYYASTGGFPADNSAAGAADPLDYITNAVNRIDVSGNTITISYAVTVNPAGSNEIKIVASTSGARLNWDCTTGSLPSEYRPSACR